MNARRLPDVYSSVAKTLRVVATILVIGVGSARAQQGFRDAVEEEGFGWLAGQWTSTTDQGEIALSYRWELNGHMVTVDFEMGEYAYRGIIFYVPDEERAIEVGVDNRGGRAKGTWELQYDKLISKSDRVDVEGKTDKVAMIHSKVDGRTMTVALHRVDENGELSEEPWTTMEFKREARKPNGRERNGDLGRLQGTWRGKEMGGEEPWTFVISGNKIGGEGPEPETYSGTIQLNTKTDPKQADFAITKCALPKYVGQTSLGIYKIEGKKLTLAASEPGSSMRPGDFEGGGDARVFILAKE